jgi:hypothetical protein
MSEHIAMYLQSKLNNFILTPFKNPNGVMHVCSFKIQCLYCYVTPKETAAALEISNSGQMKWLEMELYIFLGLCRL